MNNKSNVGPSKFFVPALMAGIMLVTLPATVAFAQRVFPANLLRQITLVAATEVAFVLWHAAALFAARGDRQHAVAQAMTWLSLMGATAMAVAEIAFEYADVGLMARLSWLGPVSLIVLGVLFASHLSAGVIYQQWAPNNVKRRSEDRAQAAIDEAVADQLEQSSVKIAAEIARERVTQQIALIRAQHSVAAGADADATRVLRARHVELPPVMPPLKLAKDSGDAVEEVGSERPLA